MAGQCDGKVAIVTGAAPGIGRAAGTACGAWQAVTGFSTWRRGGAGVDQAVLFGYRAGEIKRAYAAAVAVS